MPGSTLRIHAVPKMPDTQAVRRVLLVEDSAVQRRILGTYLQRLGFDVVVTGSAEDGLAHLRGGGIDLVISDWMLSGMDGPSLCRALREMSGDGYVYFILLTSRSDKEAVTRGLDTGADDFLAKPVGMEELRARISAGERIVRMERALTHEKRLAEAALAELRLLYNSLDDDLVEARKLQQSLVSERRRSFPGGEVNLLLQPAGHVGGDLVGCYPIGTRGVGLYALDVSGHGVASALLSTRLAVYFAGVTPERNIALMRGSDGAVMAKPPLAVAAAMNRVMLEDIGTGHYFTMILADIDLTSGRARIVQAGHPPAMIQDRDGAVRLFGPGGMPVGLLPDPQFGSAETVLRPGERLLICSDGFSEAQDRRGHLLGEERLRRQVEIGHGLRGGAFLDSLLWDVAGFATMRISATTSRP